jgi:Fe-S oxidoreductase
MQAIAELRRATGAHHCLDCGKCTSTCPLAALGPFSARLVVQQGLAGRGRPVERCLTCAACETNCPEGVRITDFVLGLRALIPEAERGVCPHAGTLQAVARATAGPEPPTRDLSWITDDLEVAEEGEVALFVGCLPFFDLYFEELGIRTLDVARAAIRTLNRLGVRPVVAADERCCGHDLLWAGDRETFETLAEANAEAFRARGVKQVLTTCAECCRTWRRDVAEAVPGYAPRVQHLAEYLADRVDAGEVRFREDGTRTLTFQDPCRLARHLGVVDAPRRVLAELPGTETAEMRYAGLDAVCCGTSGFTHCDADSRRLQARRLGEAAETGADTLVTACPKCLIHFSCAQAESRRRGDEEAPIEIEDFTVLAERRLAAGDGPDESSPVSGGADIGEAS